MPEATVILFDNSEFMRNGDYIPSRLGAEVDTVGMIAQAKCDANPENTVAIVAASGRPNVVLTLTPDVARVFTSTDKIPIVGTVDFINSFHVATVCSLFSASVVVTWDSLHPYRCVFHVFCCVLVNSFY